MAGDKLVLNPLLNFVSRALKSGNRSDEIAKTAAEFFKKDEIQVAKELIWRDSAISTRMSMKVIMTDNISDILKLLKYCDEKKIALPKYVIYEPDEVPIVPGEVSAVITRKVNEMCSKLESFIERDRPPAQWPLSGSGSSFQGPSPTPQPTYAVVLKNPPQDLRNPEMRKEYLDKVCGDNSSSIVELRALKSGWRVVLADKKSANAVAQALCANDRSVEAKVKQPYFYGIARHVPADMSDEELCEIIPNCLRALQLGNSRSFKLQFSSKVDLENAIKSPPVIHYERIPISEYLFLPMRCFNCQAFGHAAKFCKNEAKCSRCGDNHSSTKDNPCSKPIKCALCGSDKHPCYSFSCPEAQKLLAVKK